MRKALQLRLISCAMLVIAVIFVLCALSAPNLGHAFYIGPFHIGVEVWRVFYAAYALITVLLFAASFWVKDDR